jgi:hypothetical protein
LKNFEDIQNHKIAFVYKAIPSHAQPDHFHPIQNNVLTHAKKSCELPRKKFFRRLPRIPKRFPETKQPARALDSFPHPQTLLPRTNPKPNVSGAIPSACKPAFGRGSKVIVSFAARSLNGFGNSSKVASISRTAIAHNFSQFKFICKI